MRHWDTFIAVMVVGCLLTSFFIFMIHIFSRWQIIDGMRCTFGSTTQCAVCPRTSDRCDHTAHQIYHWTTSQTSILRPKPTKKCKFQNSETDLTNCSTRLYLHRSQSWGWETRRQNTNQTKPTKYASDSSIWIYLKGSLATRAWTEPEIPQ